MNCWYGRYFTETKDGNGDLIRTCCASSRGFATDDGSQCSKQFKVSSGPTRMVEHFSKKHKCTELTHKAKLAEASAAPQDIGMQMARLVDLSPNYSTVASPVDRVLRFFAHGRAFTDINNPHFRDLPGLTLPVGLKTPDDVRRELPACGVRVRHHQLKRLSHSFGTLSLDGGSKYENRYLAVVLNIAGSEPVFIALVDIATLRDGKLDVAEINRLLHFYKQTLWKVYSIRVLGMIGDNAAYMHAVNLHPQLPATEQDLRELEARHSRGQGDDPFLPTKADGIRGYEKTGGKMQRIRCTNHSLQLFVFDCTETEGGGGVPCLVKGKKLANEVFDLVKEERAKTDFKENFPDGLEFPEKGCPTRWWSCDLDFIVDAKSPTSSWG
jgi:hypothetical protein